MTAATWRRTLAARLGWSLGAASAWTWGLLLLRALRDGWPPLEVWFSYSLSFFMTAVYVYLGLLIYATIRAEGRSAEPGADRTARPEHHWLGRARGPVGVLGVVGLATAAISLVSWLALRYPGPQAAAGTVASIVLALMVLAVAVVSTLIARGAR